jgi:23S rRNA (guanosine2251-2'-O)-methyltransferase
MMKQRMNRRPDRPRESIKPAPAREAGAARTREDLVFGVEPIRELIAGAPESIRTLYLRQGTRRRFERESLRVAEAGGAVEEVDDRALAALAGAQSVHQGLVALIRPHHYAALEDLIAARPDPILIVDGVTDPRNLGALLRSAECAGVHGVIVARDRTARLTAAALKASAGAWVHLTIAECGNVVRTLEQLQQAGYWVAALAPGGAQTIYDLDTGRPLAIVVGAEGEGVRELVKKRADFVVAIPMRGRVGSLNVSVAAAVALFEIARRREPAAPARDGR